ncbi:MAG: YfhO family protein [Acidobacteria bacterium]|nr:YfhO family protein [Acidobacteriota bacterium]
MNWLKTIRADLCARFTIIIFFTLFFWPATLAGRFFVSGDALVYSYPMRSVMWEMIRQGQWPLWTPNLLSGYPLLSMAQLALGYPLTWGYAIMSGHAAEQIYVLAPFFLAPIFTYVYARQIGRSRLASLLAGLTFGFGGLMASRVATYGFLPNAVMWLPLVLTVTERARTKPFASSLLWMTLAYVMSVLTGLGQGFLYVGAIAVAYATMPSWAAFRVPPSGGSLASEAFRLKAVLKTFTPLIICLSGIILAGCLAAFQILETMQAQQQSIRSKLSYEMFSGGGFTVAEACRSFLLPFYHYLETETFVVGLAALMALAAVASLFKRANRDARIWFWLIVAVVGFVLMLGDNTPLYALLYRIPLLNLFRAPSRHAFEWTFALAILAAYGWDQVAKRIPPIETQVVSLALGATLMIATLAIGYGWWAATGKPPIPGAALQHTGLSEQGWLLWKAAFSVITLITALWNLRIANPRWRGALLILTITAACFVEPYILMQRWWFGFAKPASYFTQLSAPTKFLQQYKPEENRVYTSLMPGYAFDLPRTEPHNLSARRGLQDASGYEPLMSARYDKAFGNGGNFSTANFCAPLDRQILSPNWQVLDLLNVRFLAEFTAATSGFVEKDGARFSAGDAGIELKAGAKTVLAAPSAKVNTLTIVSALADSTDLSDGDVVAEFHFVATDGRTVTRELQAGRDSAEWAHERADVKPVIHHRLAKVFETVPGGEFPLYRYQAKFDLGEPLALDRVEIVNISKHAVLMVSKATAYDSAGTGAFLLTQRLAEHWRKVYDYDSVQIYENPRALPRAWIVPQARAVSEDEALRAIRGESAQSFSPHEVALLEVGSESRPDLPQTTFAQHPEANIVRYEPNRLTIETNTDQRGVLVVSEMNYPGWEATVDSQPVTIFHANYLLRGIVLPAGSHRVEMRYAAPAARLGAIISALALVAIGVLVLQTIRQRNWQRINTGE